MASHKSNEIGMILALLIYLAISFISILGFLHTGAVIGGIHDWNIQLTKQDFMDARTLSTFVYNSFIPPSNLYYSLFEMLLFYISGANPAFFSYILVASFLFLSGVSMFLFGRSLRLSTKACFLMGLFYMLTPVIYDK